MLFDFLLTLAFWPSALVLAFIGVLAWSTHKEDTVAALAATVIFGVGIWTLTGANFLSWVYNNPLTLLWQAVAYVAIGVLWSNFKWRKHMKSDEVQRELRDGYARMKPGATLEDFRRSVWFPREAEPSANKGAIVSWLSLWPFSVIGFVAGDVILRMFERIYDTLSGLYEGITLRSVPERPATPEDNNQPDPLGR
jgi:hypothetical protein